MLFSKNDKGTECRWSKGECNCIINWHFDVVVFLFSCIDLSPVDKRGGSDHTISPQFSLSAHPGACNLPACLLLSWADEEDISGVSLTFLSWSPNSTDSYSLHQLSTHKYKRHFWVRLANPAWYESKRDWEQSWVSLPFLDSNPSWMKRAGTK